MDRILASTNVPSAFHSTMLDDYDTRRGSRKCFRAVDDWDPTDDAPALVLQGPPNKAKTMLASALLNEYHDRFSSDRFTPDDLIVIRQERLPVYFIQLAGLIDLHLRLFKLHDLVMKGLVEPTEYLEIDQLLQDLKARVKVLVIDDVGKEHTTSSKFAEDAFDLLVRTRHNAGMTTIYTTNTPVAKWTYLYSDSMRSLIERSSRIVTFAQVERGLLGVEQRPSTVFVFEDLIAHLDRPTAERIALRLHQWELALDAWVFDLNVCNYIEMVINRFKTPVEVITWKPIGFANTLADRLWGMELPVREVKSGSYSYFSPRYAVDPEITTVYDPDPMHSHGYGFKRREFSLGNR